ncbi:MAG: ArsR/SmtB family transcription factor [Burkholderiales bacterium]
MTGINRSFFKARFCYRSAARELSVLYNIRLDIRFETSLNQLHQDIFELIGRKEEIELAARAMKAIAHPLRLKILCVLGDDEVNVQDIVDAVGTSQSNVSQHLAILREKGILRTRKDANRVFYAVSDKRTLQLISMMRQVFCGIEAEQ